MTKEQLGATRRLEKALNQCGIVGLKGGVFDGHFCVWPKGVDPHASSDPESDFFLEVRKYGEILDTSRIHLDGGAGV